MPHAIAFLFLASTLISSPISGKSSASPERNASTGGDHAKLENKISQTDWSKIRGANFIPSYASNTYEIWRNYNHDTFENELRLASAVGYNSVRLWLNYDAFDELGATMVDHVEDALRLCAKYHLRAVIVLFDSCGIRPRKDARWMPAGDAYDLFQRSPRFTADQKSFMETLFKNYVRGYGAHTLVPVGADTPFMALLWQNWQSTPGNNRLGPDWYPKLEKYVDAIVGRLKDSPNVLLWDLMNEPEFASEGFLSAKVLITPEMEKVRDAFLHHFHEHLKQRFPDEVMGVGWAALENAEKYSDLADVVTFHIYGDAAHLSEGIGKAQEYSEKSSKTILITETLANWDFGKPDFGAMATDEAQLEHYREVLPVLVKSPIGWIGWGMVISRDFDPYTDIFYPNGSPRPAAVFLEKILKAAGQTP
ncbi:MAG: hypothetical protein ACRD4K_02890 [Candidatus Acidiferrales bacterium]